MQSRVLRNLWQNVGNFVGLQAEISLSNWGNPSLAGCFVSQMSVSVVLPCKYFCTWVQSPFQHLNTSGQMVETGGRRERPWLGFFLEGECLSELQLLYLLVLVLPAVSCKGRGRSNDQRGFVSTCIRNVNLRSYPSSEGCEMFRSWDDVPVYLVRGLPWLQ